MPPLQLCLQRFAFVLLALCAGMSLSRAQVSFQRTYGGTSNDVGSSVQQTSDGGYIIAGWTSSFGAGDHVYLIKTNSSGDTLWTRTYGGTGRDYGSSVQQTFDGGYIIAGVTGEQIGGGDVYLVRTNSSGDTLWTRIFLGDPYEAYGRSVQQTSDGGYIIAGVIGNMPTEPTDVYLIKTLGDGTVSVRDDRSVMPAGFALLQNYPNPFNPSTSIKFQLPVESRVTLRIFDMVGREIDKILDKSMDAGYHSVEWNASAIVTGVYYYRLEATSVSDPTKTFSQTRKMVLMK